MIKRILLYPLKKLYWWLYDLKMAFREKQRRYRLWKRLTFPLGKKAYLIGTPLHENMGDSAIVLAQTAFLNRCGLEKERIIEITYEEYEHDAALYNKWIPKTGLIAQLGGGHLGNQWLNEEMLHRQQTTVFANNPMVIFPQTVYYTQDSQGKAEEAASVAVYNGKENLTMVAREKTSYQIMRKLYPDTRILLTPDIVLSATMETFGVKPCPREGILLCLRTDAEKSMKDADQEKLKTLLREKALSYDTTDMYSPGWITTQSRYDEVRKKMQELATARLVITDRLHGMIFCAITGTPCIVFRNNNHKVAGTAEWLRHLPYIRFVSDPAEAERCLPQLLEMKDCRFDPEPFQPYFDQLAEVVRKYAHN